VIPARPVLICFVLGAFVLPLHTQDAAAILSGARLSPTRQPAVLVGRLRTEDSTTPVTIRLKNELISYETAHPPAVFQVSLHPGSTTLSEIAPGEKNAHPLSLERLHEELPGTGVTFQDLSLGFLYWPYPVLKGEETVGIRRCWKIDLQAPLDESIYGVARVWIDREFGGILKIEVYDKKGLLLRRFQLISPQKIDGLWVPKQMRIEGFHPGDPSPISRTYLEILSRKE
jgi:Outer membrane lipoprotein-sorting protein